MQLKQVPAGSERGQLTKLSNKLIKLLMKLSKHTLNSPVQASGVTRIDPQQKVSSNKLWNLELDVGH